MVLDGGKLQVEDAVVETMEVALLHPTGIDSVSLTGDTALHAAASMGYDRMVRLLAERGASLNIGEFYAAEIVWSNSRVKSLEACRMPMTIIIRFWLKPNPKSGASLSM